MILPTATRAAERPAITLIGPVGLVRSGELLPIEVRIDSKGETINAVEASVRYSPAMFTVERVGREQSPLTLWPEEPTTDVQGGRVHFTGGRPGGFVAVNAVIATLYVRASVGGALAMAFDLERTAFYRNDGQGTRLAVESAPLSLVVADSLVQGITLTSPTHPSADSWSTQGTIVVQWTPKEGAVYSYSMGTDIAAVPDDVPETAVGEKRYGQLSDGVYYFFIKERPAEGVWSAVTQRRFLVDGTPPEPFAISRLDPKSVGGAALISWMAHDATSGINAYSLAVNSKHIVDIASPLVLQPSWRGKTLTITAYDQAGNAQSVSWKYPASSPFFLSLRDRVWLFVGILASAAVLTALAMMILSKSRRRRNRH